ncbi:MAG: hypothetical protein WCK34_06770 [Bacteroidota bacterium]
MRKNHANEGTAALGVGTAGLCQGTETLKNQLSGRRYRAGGCLQFIYFSKPITTIKFNDEVPL